VWKSLLRTAKSDWCSERHFLSQGVGLVRIEITDQITEDIIIFAWCNQLYFGSSETACVQVLQ